MANKTKSPDKLKTLAARVRTSGDVWAAVRRLGTQIAAELTDEQFFLSPEFKKYANNLARFLLRNHKLHNLEIRYDESGDVAWTDGRKIVVNAGNRLTAHPKLLEVRFKVLLGILFHEIAHMLFLDFDTHKKGINELLEGRLFGNFDVPAGSPLEANLQELRQAQADGYKNAITTVYAEVLNIINDGHDESAIKRCFRKFIAQCIIAAGLVQQELTSSLEKNVADGAPELSIFYSLMLQYAKFGYCKLGEENADTKPYTDLLSEMEPVIEAAVEEDNYTKRWDYVNILILQLWPVIKKILEQTDENSSGSSGSGGGQSGGSGSGGPGGPGGSGGNNLSDEELEQILQALANAANADNSAAPAPQNGTGSGVDPDALAAGQGGPGSDDDMSSLLNKVATEMAKGAVQQAIDKAQLEAIRNTNQPLIHKSVPVRVNRHHDADEEAYKEIYDKVKPYVRNLISAMQSLLMEMNDDGIEHHRRFGPIIEARESYRQDSAFFAKKHLPADQPNMALCVLVDESGSMGGSVGGSAESSKLDVVKLSLILLAEFANALGIPLMVAGHCAERSGVTLNIYTDWLSTQPEKDRYSLAAIRPHGCNRDGLAIRLCADMLAQRDEDIRMLVVISDGAPYDSGYSGKEAFEDIQKTVTEYKRKGLTIYGAAIDDDREVIQELYGKGFLSITDLNSLPKTMVRLLRQNII